MKEGFSNNPPLPNDEGGSTSQVEDKDICKKCDYQGTIFCDYEKGFDCRVLRGV